VSSSKPKRQPFLCVLYQQYLDDQDTAALIQKVAQCYTVGTLERLAQHGARSCRRAAVLALSFLAGYEANRVLGRALNDRDRGVRTLAENGIRSIWCRAGSEGQRQKLRMIIRLNANLKFREAAEEAEDLIQIAPWFAEAWNQRAIAFYHLGSYLESINDCLQTLEVNPYYFGAASGMGQCYLQLGDRAAALEAFRRALKLNPNLEGVRATVTYLERALKKS
jgi:tetratricopeptide (TPR) repeat protein